MKKSKTRIWNVKLVYHVNISHRDIEAETEEEAIKIAEDWTDGNLIACNAESYSADATEKTSP